jgi:hypothetical protein
MFYRCKESEKCRLIADFEGLGAGAATCSCEKHRNHLFCATGSCVGCDAPMIDVSDYRHDLNATMRAARNLPDGFTFYVVVVGNKLNGGTFAVVRDPKGLNMHNALESDAACAAFEALSKYIRDQMSQIELISKLHGADLASQWPSD